MKDPKNYRITEELREDVGRGDVARERERERELEINCDLEKPEKWCVSFEMFSKKL